MFSRGEGGGGGGGKVLNLWNTSELTLFILLFI